MSSGRAAWGLLLLLGVLSLLLLGLGLRVGSGWWQQPVPDFVLFEVRVPRLLAAWLSGALLGLAGAIAQGLFRNPLADPYLLGSAAGASLGLALALVWLGAGMVGSGLGAALGSTGAAWLGALGAVWLTLTLARGAQHTLRLLLAGVVVGVVLGAMVSLLGYWRPDILVVMQGFMLGSTAFAAWPAVQLMAVVLALSGALAWGYAKVLDALAAGEETAQSLGLPLPGARVVLVWTLAAATASSVAHTGLIAFVGLAAPHMVRALVGVTYRWRLPLSAIMGGVLLLAADLVARVLLAPQQLPVGVLTAVLGGGYLLWLMSRRRGLWGGP
ncbi:MAG: Hemin transport system permease protein HmuU [Pseudomonadota bacterium]